MCRTFVPHWSVVSCWKITDEVMRVSHSGCFTNLLLRRPWTTVRNILEDRRIEECWLLTHVTYPASKVRGIEVLQINPIQCDNSCNGIVKPLQHGNNSGLSTTAEMYKEQRKQT